MTRSMNVTIVLRQFNMEPSEIVNLIKECDGSKLGGDKLRMLLNILPEKDEVGEN